jgi:hypothetical protein
MPADRTANDYIEKKDDILTRCLRLTEDIYSAVGESDTLAALLDERMKTIEELVRLEEGSAELRQACPAEALAGLDSKLRLILSLDERIESAIADVKLKLLDSLKSNTMERKFMKYAVAEETESGRLFDKKK